MGKPLVCVCEYPLDLLPPSVEGIYPNTKAKTKYDQITRMGSSTNPMKMTIVRNSATKNGICLV